MTDAPPKDHVLHQIDNSVAWITLNRPAAGNALTPAQRDRLIDLLGAASAALEVRAVVLTAAGTTAFCTGADLRVERPAAAKPAGAPARPTGAVARMIATGAQRLIAAVQDCEKPVIAAVNGTAAGIGAHLAFACDLSIAADNARFIEVFVRRGIIPDGGGAYLLPRLVGLQKAKELVFFGDDLGAADAAALGLVNRVVAAADLMQTARDWAERLAKGPTMSIGLAKRLLNRSLDADRATAFQEEAWAQEIAMTTGDSSEGLAAFAERRPTAFNGW